jgi:hypothetical protein
MIVRSKTLLVAQKFILIWRVFTGIFYLSLESFLLLQRCLLSEIATKITRKLVPMMPTKTNRIETEEIMILSIFMKILTI